MNLRPTGKRILVKPLAPAQRTSGGIHLVETYAQPSGQAVILAVGARVAEPAFQPGARVIYNWINGLEIEHGGETCRLLHTDEVLGVAA